MTDKGYDVDYLVNRLLEKYLKPEVYYSACCHAVMEVHLLQCPKCYEHCDVLAETDEIYDAIAEIEEKDT